jgi:hypothetical protein
MDLAPARDVALEDRDLVVQFESIGDNCELGLVQRMAGAEPLGLLRFSGTPLRNLLRAMRARFQGIADPHHVLVQAEHGEYMVKLTRYDFNYHAHIKADAMPADVLHQQQCRTVRFLADKLITDLENPSKILVFRQNEVLTAADFVDLRSALAAYGPGILLWVQEARPGHPPGTVDRVDDRLLVGYVHRLAAREDVPDLDYGSWIRVLRAAYAMIRGTDDHRQPAPVPRSRTELTFGVEGNATPHLGYGWSGAEAGYIWSIGERSLLRVPVPAEAAAETLDYWLEMDVMPFLMPPLLSRQRLDVRIGDTLVHSFDPVPRGEIGCALRGDLVAGRTEVVLVLDHSQAASPVLVGAGQDDRRLGIAFRRLALVCA